MHVQTDTDQSIQGSDELSAQVEAAVSGALGGPSYPGAAVMASRIDDYALIGDQTDPRGSAEWEPKRLWIRPPTEA